MNPYYDEIITGLKHPVSLYELFIIQVTATPHAIAVKHHNKQLTYSELNQQVEILSNQLKEKYNGESIIGISTTRNIEMIIGVLAILKSGKAYLPLDPNYPAARLQQMINDSQIQYCIAPQQEQELFQQSGLNKISSTQKQQTSFGKPLAYVLYTSGSTGVPKGVCMGHAALINLLQWQKQNSSASTNTNTLQFAPLNFDVSFQEIFATLTTGGTLILMDNELRFDFESLLEYIEENNINRLFLPFVALQYLTATSTQLKKFPQCLNEVITAGEQLKITPEIIEFFTNIKHCKLHNQYGPTECHVVTEFVLNDAPQNWPALPSIGKAINNVSIYIIDEKLQLLPDGETGELCIGGDCLAEGYLNKPELTAEKFIYWDHPAKGNIRIYRTGDLAVVQHEGNIEFLGRRDTQVKIRGFRIEPGEIEIAISKMDGIQQAVVIARDDNAANEKYLAAYLISTGAQNDVAIRTALLNIFPDYMVPSAFVWLDKFPFTASGKIDTKALPKPQLKRTSNNLYKAPTTKTEKQLASILKNILSINEIGVNDNFFELGGNSLLAMRTVAAIKNELNFSLPVTKLYQHPTINGIAVFVDGKNQKQATQTKRKRTAQSKDVAIIGMSGRFPGADTTDELWNVLKEGKETISFFSDEKLSKYIPVDVKNNPDYIKARGILNKADKFDAAFFNINSKMAEVMDPQHRIFLEIAYETLESSGYLPAHFDGLIGVFAGTGNNTYYLNNILPNTQLLDSVGSFNAMVINEKDYIATRTAYTLDLKGPALSVYTACSTSLLAITQAVESLRAGKCDVALAGGVSVTAPIKSGYQYKDGAMLSPDGHCRPFDAQSAGTVFSDGAGVVLLKLLEEAKHNGDFIYGVIKGVGVNNDGGSKGNFFAPSAEGQAGAITMAIDDAGINASSITYIEAHGTATPIGDPIEIEGLKTAFNIQTQQPYCAIGSIKSNMGHLTAAAGVAGLIKTLLAMQYKQLPASINFNNLNSNINLDNTPFYVNNQLSNWQAEGKRIAGVSSFGVGGTNVHVIIEEYENKVETSSSVRPLQLITWSAKSNTSLDNYAIKLADYINNKQIDLADAAYTLQTTRPHFNHRKFVVASGKNDLITSLQSTNNFSSTKSLTETTKELVFMFPGQDSRYTNMFRELYDNEAAFKNAVDKCAAILLQETGEDIRQIIYPIINNDEAEARLANTLYAQPCIFVTSYALSELWLSWGIKPTVLVGHSIGELVAAYMAGIFSLEDSLKFVAKRSKMMAALPPGNMVAVRIKEEEIRNYLIDGVDVAGINSDDSCVLSGPAEAINKMAEIFAEKNIAVKMLSASHAFHSAMLDEIVQPLKEYLQTIQLNAPRLPIVSTVTGTWMKDAEAISADYWANQLRKTVAFNKAIKTTQEDENRILVEVGTGGVTVANAKASLKGKSITIISSVNKTQGEYATLLKALGQFWLNGFEPNWKAFYANEKRNKIQLPTYAFDKKRCWIDPVTQPLSTITESKKIEEPKPAKIITEPQINLDMQEQPPALTNKLKQILEDASGIDANDIDAQKSFIEMGIDSLLLTQLTLTLKKEFAVPLTFRQLNDGLHNIHLLAGYINQNSTIKIAEPALSKPLPTVAAQSNIASSTSVNNDALQLLTQQLDLISKQVALMQGQQVAQTPPSHNFQPVNDGIGMNQDVTPEEAIELKKPFGATARIEKNNSTTNTQLADFIKKFTKAYNLKTIGSKNYTQQNRSHMADPRVVSGFRPATKEITYSIVAERSKGSRLWDVDGNEYVDALNGFGSNMFGYQPEFLKKAVMEQVEKGYEIGPQHVLAGEVCKLICEFTNFDRSALCNTGSEAVLGAMRIARTVTNRSTIVAFTGSYHGIVDEVIVRGTKKLKSFPAASGIMPEAVQNMLILDYGTDESLRIIEERADEIAAVLVEPVQSRRPEFQPVEFLQALRKITAEKDVVLIFDEVITGFRMHTGGTQAMFGVKADLATYGKVIGGGMPIGAIAGKSYLMDALDGGIWQFGDDSVPESGVTYFAGTFVRHPLTLATAKASLLHMKLAGNNLQNTLNENTVYLANALNNISKKYNLPLHAVHFGSLWKLKFDDVIPYSELLFTLMRYKGIHIYDGFPCFLTEAHTKDDIDFIIQCFKESIIELVNARLFSDDVVTENYIATNDEPPVAGARLGRDAKGNPGWYKADPKNMNIYLKIQNI